MDFRRNIFFRNSNPDIDLPPSCGNRWSDNEEKELLDELSRNIDIEKIAQKHGRTIGGISARIRDIAYKMYISNFTFDKIIEATKLTREQINEIIEKKEKIKEERKEKYNNTFKNTSEHILHIKQHNYDNELKEIKTQLTNVEKKLDRLFDLLKTLEVV